MSTEMKEYHCGVYWLEKKGTVTYSGLHCTNYGNEKYSMIYTTVAQGVLIIAHNNESTEVQTLGEVASAHTYMNIA